jgi:hypothetical protein
MFDSPCACDRSENLEYVGEFYRLSSDRRNLFNWYPFLLFLSGLLTSVFMVNLLSAIARSPHTARSLHRPYRAALR